MAQKIASWWLDVQGRFDDCMVALDDDIHVDVPTAGLAEA
jgi:hypothetical protein